MRFIGMLFIWLGGVLLLYTDLQEPIRIVSEYMESKAKPEGMSALSWIQMFARPLFVFGVICAVGMPKLGAKKKGKKKGKPKAPAKVSDKSTAKPSS
jgi:cytochrome c oxidase assembly factor CtaG